MNQFKDYYYRTYLAHGWSFQHIFCIFIYYLIIAIPFYFSFGGQFFWIETTYQSMQLDYQYTGYYALQSNYIDNSNAKQTQQYSTIPSSDINTLLDSVVTVNDQPSNTTITVSLSAYSTKTLTSLNGIFFYDVELPTLGKKVSVGYMFTVGDNFHTASINGQMQLQASEPINAIIGEVNALVDSPAYFTSAIKTPTTFAQLAERQFQMNYTISTNTFMNRLSGSQATRTVTISLIKDIQQIIPYYPSLLETLKFKFSRYLAFVMVGYLLFRTLMVVLIRNEGLECTTIDDVPSFK